MFSFPPLPPYEGLHPLVVHFPIALLLTVWIPALSGLFLRKHTQHFWFATLLWLALGVTGAMAAVSTGEAASDIALVTTDAAKTLLHEHEEAGELTRTLFIITFLLALTTFLLRYVYSVKKPIIITAMVITTLLYIAASLTLINAAHQGGTLVHHHGLHAPITTTPTQSPSTVP
ncbi:MAG: DUF2231 domain-containing protein [Phycisphaerales bacterium]